jgi:hypothetical protein
VPSLPLTTRGFGRGPRPGPWAEADLSHPIARSLKSYWGLGEMGGVTLRDATGRYSTGSGAFVAAPTWGMAGGQPGLTFNGTSQYVTLPPAVGVCKAATGNPVFSASAWIRYTSASASLGAAYAEATTANTNNQFEMGVVNGKVRAQLKFNVSTATAVTSTPLYNDGKWHLAAFTSDGTTGTLYVDAANVATVAMGTVVGLATAALGVLPRGTPTDFFAGTVGPVANWTRCLQRAEVWELWENPGCLLQQPPPRRFFFGPGVPAAPRPASPAASLGHL